MATLVMRIAILSTLLLFAAPLITEAQTLSGKWTCVLPDGTSAQYDFRASGTVFIQFGNEAVRSLKYTPIVGDRLSYGSTFRFEGNALVLNGTRCRRPHDIPESAFLTVEQASGAFHKYGYGLIKCPNPPACPTACIGLGAAGRRPAWYRKYNKVSIASAYPQPPAQTRRVGNNEAHLAQTWTAEVYAHVYREYNTSYATWGPSQVPENNTMMTIVGRRTETGPWRFELKPAGDSVWAIQVVSCEDLPEAP